MKQLTFNWIVMGMVTQDLYLFFLHIDVVFGKVGELQGRILPVSPFFFTPDFDMLLALVAISEF